MNKWKKVTAVCMSAAMMCGGALGYTTTVSADDKVVLDVWHQFTDPESAQTKTFLEAVEKYQEENENIEIELHGLDTESYKTKISTEFASSASGVDVFYYWAPGKIKQLINADKVLPLNDYVTDEVMSRVKEGSTSSFEFGDNLYALPIDSYMMCLFCNKTLFDEAGVEIPTTYDELIAAGEKLLELDGVTPLAIGAKDSWLAGAFYESLALREVGAEEVQSALLGETEFTNEGFKKAAEDVVELYEKGILGKNPLEDGEAEATADFLNGKVAMQLDGSWFAGTIDNTDDTVVTDVEAITFPVVSDEQNATDYAGGASASFFVNKNTDTPAEAADFAIYISEQMGVKALEIGSGFPCWNTEIDESVISPTFIKLMDLYDGVQTGVQNWDGILDANAAAVHLEQAQSLLVEGADLDTFMAAHQDAISAQG
ncbi:ABC transporter substrate-binding protein [Ruminococcus sp. 5_1_39BFAA]|uniref:ABC transporter substrate-binding protein n=1 Tax=Ruminococcus sp. 5_1_39BFAA TaxID=457412 RepID=UPI003568EAA4